MAGVTASRVRFPEGNRPEVFPGGESGHGMRSTSLRWAVPGDESTECVLGGRGGRKRPSAPVRRGLVEGRAVDVFGLSAALARESEDGRTIDQAVDRCDGLRL